MTIKRRSGMVPYFIGPNGSVEFLLMIPLNPKISNKPQIAKGWMEDNEDAFEAARREAKEELGLKKKNMKRVPLHLGQWDNTEIFMVEIISKEKFKAFDKDEVKKTIWMTIEEFRKGGRRSNRPVIELVNIIAKHIMHLESK